MHVVSARGPSDDRAAGSGAAPEVAETHSAIVFQVGDRAYKMKKAVDLGFLDLRSREARQAVCHREVELMEES